MNTQWDKYKVNEDQSSEILPNNPDYGLGMREDKTPKGKGYFGAIQMLNNPNQAMGELSSEVNVGGKNILFPLIVPSLNAEELNFLAQGNKPTDVIMKKAIDHAIQRINQKRNPFASIEEEEKTPLPKGVKSGQYQYPKTDSKWSKYKE